ncbi:ankyrin repeat-containing domain protein [Aspergillus pseudoustus]|uniref:Ankyrin repeat-containing domain protein n=1 Tax=Aspergillus pseudoustus TaxID=1810923 RepID=A0ABR4JVA2_9EURO
MEEQRLPACHISNLPMDIIIEILGSLPDLRTLFSAIRTCCHIYRCFKQRKSVTITSIFIRMCRETDPPEEEPLLHALALNNSALAEALLRTDRREVDVNARDSDKRTALSIAAEKGYTAVVQLLLQTADVDANSQDCYGCTPLLKAAECGHGSVVRLLLENSGINVDLANCGGETPLSRGAQQGHAQIVKMLVETGKPDVNSRDTRYDLSPIGWAAMSGHVEVVRVLLESDSGRRRNQEIDLNTPDKEYRRTPLFWASHYGHSAVMRLLLATGRVEVLGLDEDSFDVNCRIPILAAAQEGDEELMEVLLRSEQVDVNSSTWDDGRTPLSLAAQFGHEGIVKLLLETGKVRVNAKDSERSWTPLTWAKRGRYEGVVQLLLEAGGVETLDWVIKHE